MEFSAGSETPFSLSASVNHKKRKLESSSKTNVKDSKRTRNMPFGLVDNFVMSICAPRKSGKSYLIGEMLSNGLIDAFDNVVIMSPTIKFGDDYERFESNEKVTLISCFDADDINTLFEDHERCMTEVREIAKEIKSKKRKREEAITCPRTLLILDDCIDSGVMSFHGVVDKIAERGRHVEISLIASSQRQSAISRSVRLNSDYFLIFSPYSVGEMEKFLEEFVSKSFRSDLRDKALKIFEQEYQFIVLDNSEKDISKKMKFSNAHDFINNKLNSVL